MNNKKLTLTDLNVILIVSREHELHDEFINQELKGGNSNGQKEKSTKNSK